MNQEGLAKTNVILATCILGSLGALVRSIPMPGSVVALGRGFVAVVFLLVLMLAKNKSRHGRPSGSIFSGSSYPAV